MPESFKTERPARMLRAALFAACATLSVAMMATACRAQKVRPHSSIEVAFTYQGKLSMQLQEGLKPIAAKHGIPGLTWHALRHTCRACLSSGRATLTT